jgi:energy-converting hydrogenase Eha subunit H
VHVSHLLSQWNSGGRAIALLAILQIISAPRVALQSHGGHSSCSGCVLKMRADMSADTTFVCILSLYGVSGESGCPPLHFCQNLSRRGPCRAILVIIALCFHRIKRQYHIQPLLVG